MLILFSFLLFILSNKIQGSRAQTYRILDLVLGSKQTVCLLISEALLPIIVASIQQEEKERKWHIPRKYQNKYQQVELNTTIWLADLQYTTLCGLHHSRISPSALCSVLSQYWILSLQSFVMLFQMGVCTLFEEAIGLSHFRYVCVATGLSGNPPHFPTSMSLESCFSTKKFPS